MNETDEYKTKSLVRRAAVYMELFERGDQSNPNAYMLFATTIDEALRSPNVRLFHDTICSFDIVREIRRGIRMEKKIISCRSSYFPELDALIERLTLPFKD